MSIRSTVKAIIINDGRVLLNRCSDKHNGEYYSLPGGGQDTYETLHEALVRECLEETGYTVNPKNFIALFEEICEDSEINKLYPEYIHKMYHIFLCELAEDARKDPTEVDDAQLCSEWIDVEVMDEIRMMPEVLNGNMKKMISSEVAVFLGSERIAHNHG